MNARTSPSSRRSSSRRKRSSVRASSGSDSMTRSMYSTWKIALVRAWAGPSWISWASRERSASWASTMRIWSHRSGCRGCPSRRVRLHRMLSIRVVIHGQTISNARALPSGPPAAVPAPVPRSSSRKHDAPSTPASRSAGQCRLSASRRTTSCALNRGRRQVEHVARRFVGECQGRDPLRLRHPDREIRDDRSGRGVERMTDPGHGRGQGLVALGGGRVSPSRTTAGSRPRRAASRRRRGARRARRPVVSSPGGPRPRRSPRPARAAPTRRAGPAPGPAAWRKVPHVVATGKTRLVTRNVATDDDDERPDRGSADRPRQRDEADDRDRDARQEQDVEQVVGEPLDAHLEERAGPTAR